MRGKRGENKYRVYPRPIYQMYMEKLFFEIYSQMVCHRTFAAGDVQVNR